MTHNDRAMIRQICNAKPEDVATIRSNELLTQLEINDLDVILRRKGLAGSDMLNALACTIPIKGKRGLGWPKLTWDIDRGKPS